MKDTRIAFGAGCTWWGPIDEVAKGGDTGMGIPSCPFCRGVLYEDPDIRAWQTRLTRTEQMGYPNYSEVMIWQHDVAKRCYKSWIALRQAYDSDKTAPKKGLEHG